MRWRIAPSQLFTAWFLALRMIWRGRFNVTLIIIIVLSVGVINVLFTYGLFSNLTATSQEKIIDTQFGHIVMTPIDGSPGIANAHDLRATLLDLPRVTGVSIHYYGYYVVSRNNKETMIEIAFIDPHDEMSVTYIHDYVIEGEMLLPLDTNTILLGNEAAGAYDPIFIRRSITDVYPGDVLYLHTPQGKQPISVKGIFHAKNIESDFMTYMTHTDFINLGGDLTYADSISIRLAPNVPVDQMVDELYAMGIDQNIQNTLNYSGVDMTDTLLLLRQIFVIFSLMVSIAILIISLVINIYDHQKVIAIIRAIGVPKQTLILTFVFQSMIFAAVAGAVGIIVFFTIFIPYFHINPINMPFGFIGVDIPLGISIFIGLLFTLLGGLGVSIPTYILFKKDIVSEVRG